LGPVTPDGTSDPFSRNAVADLINLARAITVRNDARICHAVPKCVLAFLDIAWIDPGCGNANTNLLRRGNRIRHLSDRQYFPGWALLLVPRCLHFTASLFLEKTVDSIAVLKPSLEGSGETGIEACTRVAQRT